MNRKLMALFLLFVLCSPLFAMDQDQSLPVVNHGPLEQLIGVLFIPVDMVRALIDARGEYKVQGQAYHGDYARHGYYRTHARWWDMFVYQHETE